jgi:uncharacterized protein with ATP-grasp and redox domains
MTSEPGSFARLTIVERKPQIVRQVIEDNQYPPEIVQALKAFTAEIAGSPMQPVKEPAADASFWNRALAQFPGRTWLEVPWYFAETFFYRRLLEAVRYFQPGEWHRRDPFQAQKRRQIQADVKWFSGEWESFCGLEPDLAFEALLHSCLWGNRADLSNFTVKVKALGGMATASERQYILIDDTEKAYRYLSRGLEQVDLVTDNVGKELLFDLALAGFLIDQGWVKRIVFRLKDRPFFVSDAMIDDVQFTLEGLQAAASQTAQATGHHLAELIASQQIQLTENFFWTSCLMYRQLPQSLWEDLSSADLVILKGDVNYRRILDDLHWPHDTRMEEVARYFPAPFLTLRTLKGEIMVGLQPGQAEKLQAEDPTWLINGKRGLIQLVAK